MWQAEQAQSAPADTTTRATDFGEASRMLLFISKGKLARKFKNTAKATKIEVSGKVLKICAGYRHANTC